MSPCTVVIADDVEAMRMLVRSMLGEYEDIEVVGEAADGVEAVAAVLAFRPDVLLLDLSMPGMDGLQTLMQLRAQQTATRVVVFSSFARDRLGPLLLAEGAVAYVEKGASPEVLARTIRDAAATPPDGAGGRDAA